MNVTIPEFENAELRAEAPAQTPNNKEAETDR